MNRIDKLLSVIESFCKEANFYHLLSKYAQYEADLDDEVYNDLATAAHDIANLTANKKGESLLNNLVDELILLGDLYKYTIENNSGYNTLYEKARQLKEVNTDLNTLLEYGQKGRDIAEIIKGSDRFDGLTDEIMNKAIELAGSKQAVLSPDNPQTVKELDRMIRGHRNDQMENDIKKEIGTGFALSEASDESPEQYAPGVPANIMDPAAKGLGVSEEGKSEGWSAINSRTYKEWDKYYKDKANLYSELKGKQKDKSKRYDEVIKLFNQLSLVSNRLNQLNESAIPVPEDQLIKHQMDLIREVKELRDPKKIEGLPKPKPISIKEMKEKLDKIYKELNRLNELKKKREEESDDPTYREISRLKAELKELRMKVDNSSWVLRKDRFQSEKDKLLDLLKSESNPVKVKLLEYKIKLLDADLEILDSKGSYVRNAQVEKNVIKEVIRYLENSASINEDYLSKLDNKINEAKKLKTSYKRHADKGTIAGDVDYCQQKMTAFFADVRGVDNLCALAWEHVAVKTDAYLNIISEKKRILTIRKEVLKKIEYEGASKSEKDLLRKQLKQIDDSLIKWNQDLGKIVRATLSSNVLVNEIIKRFDTSGTGRHSEPKSDYMRVLRDTKKLATEGVFDSELTDVNKGKLIEIFNKLNIVRESLNLPGLENSSKFNSIKEVMDKIIKDIKGLLS